MLKTVKKFAWLVACAALVFGAVSCSDPEDPETPATSGPAAEQPGDDTGTEPDTPVTPGEGDQGGSEDQGGDDDGEAVSAVTYNFVGQTAAYFGAESEADGTQGVPAEKTLGNGATVKSDSEKIRVRMADGVSTALNYNGTNYNDTFDAAIADPANSVDRYISFPIPGAGTVTLNWKGVASSKNSGNRMVGIVDASGNVLATDTFECATGKEDSTLTATVTAATTGYIIFSRCGGSGGGIDVYSIAFEPAAAE